MKEVSLIQVRDWAAERIKEMIRVEVWDINDNIEKFGRDVEPAERQENFRHMKAKMEGLKRLIRIINRAIAYPSAAKERAVLNAYSVLIRAYPELSTAWTNKFLAEVDRMIDDGEFRFEGDVKTFRKKLRDTKRESSRRAKRVLWEWRPEMEAGAVKGWHAMQIQSRGIGPYGILGIVGANGGAYAKFGKYFAFTTGNNLRSAREDFPTMRRAKQYVQDLLRPQWGKPRNPV